eukprot:CAMPEP_0174932468 /NCGR_PEP_ID=MMETSP1355-20121228/35718_1 /TAXON_ID=464990 /ORGANISM="Hemiselmis tepida, Strain CCMP443" /LENGTH=73 /DNA_ID=CAMNT_0016178883 /DNA_START=256 /DNA_END=473 /DNA_ORIENTATION=-
MDPADWALEEGSPRGCCSRARPLLGRRDSARIRSMCDAPDAGAGSRVDTSISGSQRPNFKAKSVETTKGEAAA